MVTELSLPALFVVGVWWLSTGVVLGMVWLRRSLMVPSVVVVSVVALVGLAVLRWSSEVATSFGAYVAFAAAIAMWAWHELVFLLGLITGPRKIACPPDARGLERFRLATATVIHHELALAATLALVVLLTRHAPNQVGAWTFGVLWVMRLSSKLNLFLGVRTVTDEFIPEHLRYLLTYFRRARFNGLMAISLIGSTIVAGLLGDAALHASEPFRRTALTLVGILLALGIIEHVCLVVPLREAFLWRWAIRRGASGEKNAKDFRASASHGAL